MSKSTKPGAVVLLSAGLDSTFNLYKAAREMDLLLALTFDYGQRAAAKEIACAAELARTLNVPHKVIALPWFKEFTRTALIAEVNLPKAAEVRIGDHARSLETAKAVWVPNRNGIFLNIAAGFAEGLGAEFVIPGFNREEAATFPDNSLGFLRTLDESWKFSTATQVKPKCFSADMDKTEIVAEALKMKLPLKRLWPCYEASAAWCGLCESCQRFDRALRANGLSFSQLRGDD
jgi:7-cyano-7-deazaguanine synthase